MTSDSSPYSPRVLDRELDELLPALPAIALDGAKGVGKTETARQRARTVHALDEPGAVEIAGADPGRLLAGEPPVLIDEWQRYPQSWDLVRRSVDEDRSGGRFLLTGSATPRDPGTHSGAGRIVRLRMRPMTLSERGIGSPTVSLRALLGGDRGSVGGSSDARLEQYVDELCASGFPGLRGVGGRALGAQLDGYLDQIIDRDFPDAGRTIRNPAGLRRWLTAYAAATSTTTTFDAIRDAATPGDTGKAAKTTTSFFRDTLERLWILDPLPAWLPTRHHLRRLGHGSKHHLADPALAVRLLGVDRGALLDSPAAGSPRARDATLLGQLFESLVTLDVRVYAQAAEAKVGHLRTQGGDHEIDLIVQRRDHRVVALEVKLSQTVGSSDVRHLLWLRDRMGNDLLDAAVITTGSEAYRRQDGIAVIPAALLGP